MQRIKPPGLAAVMLLFISLHSSAQDLVYPVVNYTTKEYGRDFHPENMSVAIDSKGLVYAANGFKLLVFDGRHWNSYPINREAWILSLAIDSNDVVYAGSQNEFGYFAPDLHGKLVYNSLSDSLDDEEKDFTNIWKVHVLSEGVVFQSEEKIFLYSNGKMLVIRPETSFHTSFLLNDVLYVRERGRGLMVLRDNVLTLLKGSEIFADTGIFLLLPYGNDKMLAGTREKGFWLYDPGPGNAPFRPYALDNEDLTKGSVITGGVLAGDGAVVLSTMMRGIVIIDPAGRNSTVIDITKGIKDNDVRQLISDGNGDLWAATNNGITWIGLGSGLSVYNERNGINGSVNSIARYDGLLYAGTTSGLVVQNDGSDGKSLFTEKKGLSSPVRSLLPACGYLFAGADDGLHLMSGSSLSKIDDEPVYSLLYSAGMEIVFAGGSEGMRAYRCRGGVIRLKELSLDGADIIGMTITGEKSDGSYELWLGTRYEGVIRTCLKNGKICSSVRFDSGDGLPDGPVIPGFAGGNLYFGTIRGLYSFIDEDIVKESLPDSLKENPEFARGFFSALNDSAEWSSGAVSSFAETGDKIWICTDNKAGYLDKRNDLKYDSRPFRGIDAGKINVIWPEDNGICWIGATEGLIRYDGMKKKNYDPEFFTLIRKVTLIGTDSSLFLGNGKIERDGVEGAITIQRSEQFYSLPYRLNSIRFDFAATWYEEREKTLYSFRIGSDNSQWSPWSTEGYREFTNLREGEYTFYVKARNIYGAESLPSIWSFTVLPPWYRTITAYVFYFILAVIMLYVSARIYSYRLRRENLRLEGIVTERTAEVVRQKNEILQKNVVLEHQKKEIEDSIRYASRIQSAVIPTEQACMVLCPGTFVLFRPLNIVSGDFYWISRAGSRIVYTAADCTGHGVPGAFMSMLGVAFLNEIVNKDNITSPELILNNLRMKVIEALQQQGLSGETRDGMDIALVTIDTETGVLEYAGAYNPLIMIRKGELTEFPGEKMPIGYHENMQSFRKHSVTVEVGDMFYMYSDGYEDQFGGPDGKKFKSKKLKNLFLDIAGQNTDEQKIILERTFDEWKGDNPQVDDVVMVGIRIDHQIIA